VTGLNAGSALLMVFTLKRGEIFEGRGRHHSRFVPLFCCWPPRHAVLGVAGCSRWGVMPATGTLDPGFVGAPLRRLLDDPRCADELTGRIARPATTMGQGAHHLGSSLAPALPNPLLRRGIGASSLPAPPLVTTLLVQVDWRRGTTIAPTKLGAGSRTLPMPSCGMGRDVVRACAMHIARTRDERCLRRGAATGNGRLPRLHASATDNAIATTAMQTLRSIPDRW